MDTPKKLFAVIPAGKEEKFRPGLETEQKHAWLSEAVDLTEKSATPLS